MAACLFRGLEVPCQLSREEKKEDIYKIVHIFEKILIVPNINWLSKILKKNSKF